MSSLHAFNFTKKNSDGTPHQFYSSAHLQMRLIVTTGKLHSSELVLAEKKGMQ